MSQPINVVARTDSGRPAAEERLYVLESGSLTRADDVNPASEFLAEPENDPGVQAFLEDETLIQVYEDAELTQPAEQPLTSDRDGVYMYFVDDDVAGDYYSPADSYRRIRPFVFGGGGASGKRSNIGRAGTFLVFGDSSCQNCGRPWSEDPGVAQAVQSANSFAAYVGFFSRGRARMTHNAGVSGDTTGVMLARVQEDVLDLDPFPAQMIVHSTPGGNDFGTYTTEQTIENLTGNGKLYDKLGSLGLPVFIATNAIRDEGEAGTLPKVGGGTYTAAQYHERVRAINEAVRAYARTHPNFIVWDVHSILIDPETGQYRDDYSADGTHWKAQGSCELGRDLAASMEPFLGQDQGLASTARELDIILDNPEDYWFTRAPSNAVQFINAFDPAGGDYTLEIEENELGIPTGITAPIAWNAAGGVGGALTLALEAVWGAGNFVTTGAGLDATTRNHFITWTGDFAGQSVPLFKINSALTGASSPATVSKVTNGGMAGGGSGGWSASASGDGVLRTWVEDHPDGHGKVQWFELVDGTGGIDVTVSHALPEDAIAIGDVYFGEMEMFVPDDWVDPSAMGFYVQAATPDNRLTQCPASFGILPDPGAFQPGPCRGVFRTPTVESDQNVELAGVSLYLNVEAGTKFGLARAGARRVL